MFSRISGIAAVVAVLCVSGVWGAPAPTTQPELRTAQSVNVQYYISLPQDWSAEKTWPIVVTLDGSAHTFEHNCQGFMSARKKLPFIIVTQCVSTNGNDPADAKAVLAIVKEVQQADHGQAKFFVTGFSAGGHVTWQLIFTRPELLAGVAPAAAAYRGRGIADISDAPEREQLPIHAFQGDKDPYLNSLNQQWAEVEQIAKSHGYKNIDRTMVPGAGHNAFGNETLAFFASLLPH